MKQDIKKSLTIIRENEQLLKNFFEIEKIILRIHTFTDLITTLLKELKSSFNLQYVGITFFKGKISAGDLNIEYFIEQINDLCKLISKPRRVRFLLKNSKPRLDDKNLDKWKDFFSPEIIKTAGSIAVTPLLQNEKIIGSLNLADNSKSRYNPTRETIFLERLAVIISICIDNVIKHEQLRYLSNTDVLTGLANRRQVLQVIELELARSRRDGSYLALLYVDLDDLKKINDSYGHDAGDLCLKQLSNILVKETRAYDCVGRLGGDEFVVVLCRTNYKDAFSTRERIQKSLTQKSFQDDNIQIKVRASIGLASTYQSKFNSADEFLKEADQMLYLEKKKHKSKKSKNRKS